MTCMSNKMENNKNITYKYSNGQRKHTLRSKQYSKEKEEIKKTTNINGKTIKEIETELNVCNFKTNDFEKLQKYAIIKCEVNKLLKEEYKKMEYRKYRWYLYINGQKADSEMINGFEKKMGSPKDTVVVVGDWDEGNCYKKFNEPAICKRVKKLLRKRGYKVYLINEYNTSKLCNKCEKEMKNYIDSNGKEIWGLKCCENTSCKPTNGKSKREYEKRIYDRDINATLNMLKIIKELKETGQRPKKYTKKW